MSIVKRTFVRETDTIQKVKLENFSFNTEVNCKNCSIELTNLIILKTLFNISLTRKGELTKGLSDLTRSRDCGMENDKKSAGFRSNGRGK